jgi:hypothetical protein
VAGAASARGPRTVAVTPVTPARLCRGPPGRDSRDDEKDTHVTNVVEMDFETDAEAQEVGPDEELVIYRDLMRSSGIWAFPGLQR